MQLKMIGDSSRLRKALRLFDKPIAIAATRSIRETVDEAKSAGRADIAAAGFGTKWQNAMRGETYPRRGQSMEAAGWLYHRIPYAHVFEEGATIRGRPRLWIPTSWVPKRLGGKRMTPENYTKLVGKLTMIEPPGKKPMLIARVGMSATKAAGPLRNISRAALKKGAAGGGKNRRIRGVPVFIGLDSVTLRKRFNLRRIFSMSARALPGRYSKHIQAIEGGR